MSNEAEGLQLLLKVLPKKGINNLWIAVVIGIGAWAIASPIIGNNYDYGTGALVGQIIGCISLGVLLSKLITGTMKSMNYIGGVALVSFFTIYSSGITLLIKSQIDILLKTTSDTNFLFGYILSYGAIYLIFVGFFISVNKLRKPKHNKKIDDSSSKREK